MRLSLGACTLTIFSTLLIPAVYGKTSANEVEDLLSLSLEELLNVPITSTAYFEEDSLHVGSTVTVISEQDWQHRGARRLHDALLSQPALTIHTNFLGQYSVRIRGFAQSDARGIETLWDGVPLASYHVATSDLDRPNIQLNTLDSIEVIRGPGSAFYGAGAFHGVISLNSFDSDRDTTQSSLGLASNGYYSGAVKLSRSIGQDHRLNLAISTNGQPDQNFTYDYTDTGSGLPASNERDYHYNSYTISAKLKSDPHKTWSYNIGLYYDLNDQDDFHGNGRSAPDIDTSDNEAGLGMGKISITRKLDTNRSIEFQSYHWRQEHDFDRFLSVGGNRLNIHGEETRSAAKLIYRHDKLFGNTQLSLALGHRHEKINDAHRTITNPSGGVIAEGDLLFKGLNRTITSLLMDNKTTFMNNDLTLRYGFRYDDYSDFGKQTTPRLGLIYALGKQETIKLLYGNAFRAPTAVEIGGNAFITGNPNIQPETIDTYELVYMRQTKNSKFEAVLFTSRWKDSILAIDTNNDGNPDVFANTGNNNSKGLEISYDVHIGKWAHQINGSYVSSTNEDTNEDYVAFPKYIINIGTGYRINKSLSFYMQNRLMLKAQNGPGEGNFTTNELPTYWRTDLNLTQKIDKKTVIYANIRNLFNRKNYLSSLVDMEGGARDEEVSLEAGIRYTL